MDDDSLRKMLCCGGVCQRPHDCWSDKERHVPQAKVDAVEIMIERGKALIRRAWGEVISETARENRKLLDENERLRSQLANQAHEIGMLREDRKAYDAWAEEIKISLRAAAMGGRMRKLLRYVAQRFWRCPRGYHDAPNRICRCCGEILALR
jgi:rRNA maturation endonuclease Nob1